MQKSIPCNTESPTNMLFCILQTPFLHVSFVFQRFPHFLHFSRAWLASRRRVGRSHKPSPSKIQKMTKTAEKQRKNTEKSSLGCRNACSIMVTELETALKSQGGSRRKLQRAARRSLNMHFCILEMNFLHFSLTVSLALKGSNGG